MTSPTCVGCEEIKQHLKNLGLEKDFRFLDVTTPEGALVAEKLGITHVPNCVVIEETDEGRRARVCSDDEFLKLLKKK